MPALTFPPMTLHMVDGREERVEIWPADLYRYEVQTGQSISVIGENMGLRHMFDLAFLAAKRTGLMEPGASIDDFLDQVREVDVDVEVPKDDSATEPVPAPSTGS